MTADAEPTSTTDGTPDESAAADLPVAAEPETSPEPPAPVVVEGDPETAPALLVQRPTPGSVIPRWPGPVYDWPEGGEWVHVLPEDADAVLAALAGSTADGEQSQPLAVGRLVSEADAAPFAVDPTVQADSGPRTTSARPEPERDQTTAAHSGPVEVTGTPEAEPAPGRVLSGPVKDRAEPETSVEVDAEAQDGPHVARGRREKAADVNATAQSGPAVVESKPEPDPADLPAVEPAVVEAESEPLPELTDAVDGPAVETVPEPLPETPADSPMPLLTLRPPRSPTA